MTVSLDEVIRIARSRYEYEDSVHKTANGMPLSERDLTNQERLALLHRVIADAHIYGDALSYETMAYHVLSALRATLIAAETDPAAGVEGKAA